MGWLGDYSFLNSREVPDETVAQEKVVPPKPPVQSDREVLRDFEMLVQAMANILSELDNRGLRVDYRISPSPAIGGPKYVITSLTASRSVETQWERDRKKANQDPALG